ncbi:hypothetical protein D3C87_1287450 [compost metagenome]
MSATAISPDRYQVVDGSESAHCCFEATVVDTHTPHPVYRDQHAWVCECFERVDAEKIASALNTVARIESANAMMKGLTQINEEQS